VNLKQPIPKYMPGGELEHVYSDETQQAYMNMDGEDRKAMPPHAWNLATCCWQAMFAPLRPPATSNDQAIVITGESGAGKSFQTEKMLNFLAFVGANPDSDPNAEKVTDQMLDTVPILEGFGNANMPRNPDSSRFGKLYKVYFDKHTKFITGCEIENYMLEKSRISSHQIGERNYHAFYRMLFGFWGEDPWTGKIKDGKKDIKESQRLPADGRTRYELRDLMHFDYLRGGRVKLPDHEVYQDRRPPAGSQLPDNKAILSRKGGADPAVNKDVEDFEDRFKMGKMYKAMKSFFSEEVIDSIFSNTMGVLWLGNVEIKGGDDKSEVVDAGKSKEALDMVAKLWKCDRAALMQACNTISLEINKKWVQSPQGLTTAYSLRDSMAKSVYEKQFDFIVEKCSEKLLPPNKDADVWTGVLDIFGFEFVQTDKIVPFVDKKGNPNEAPSVNSFEQFCINLCNEQLQGHFVDCIFKLEKQLYKEQLGDPDFKIKFTPNDDTIDLIVNRKTGIINALDEVAKNPPRGKDPDAGDNKFYEKMKKNFSKHKRISWPPTKGRAQYYGNGFELDHYAALVRYDVKNWVSKDADKVSHDTYVCLGQSADAEFLQIKFSEEAEQGNTGSCIGGAFKNKLTNLIKTLQSADSNFVRCIKCSNPLMQDMYYAKEVLNQLRYTGMLDTLKIRRAGFAMRLSYQGFYDMYRVLDVNAENHVELVESVQKMLPEIVARLPDPPAADQKNPDGTWNAIHVGRKGLILARDWLDRELDIQARLIKGKSAVIIQSVYRANEYTKQYKRDKSAWDIQSCCRALSEAMPYSALRRTTLSILPEMHAFTGRIITNRMADINEMNQSRNEMNAFLEDNRRLEKQEADERKQAATEDEYSWKLMDATFSERVNADKEQYLAMADTAYKTAIASVNNVKEFIDTTAKKGAEADARWQKMQTEGVVRAVPLVRQYKDEAVAFAPPSKDAYRFKYSFSYKGAKPGGAATPPPAAGKGAPVEDEPAGKGAPGGKGAPVE